VKLFDNIIHDYVGPAQYGEPKFEYLNRSGRIEVDRIRQELERWFSRYSTAGQKDLRERFRSTSNSKHQSAFFELFLHELLLRVGYTIEVHPETKTQTRRPDFLAKSDKGSNFYMEAVIATDESISNSGASARVNAVFDHLNQTLNSPNFWIGMKLHGTPKTPPNIRKIRRFLKDHLVTISPREIEEIFEFDGIDALPHWKYEHDGWEITFFPVPKSPKSRGKGGCRPLGIEIYEPHWIDSRTAIRKAIVSKGGRYGDLDLPYIVAVNALGEHTDEIDVMEALFGKEQFKVRLNRSEPEFSRIPDGVWTSKSGPRYTRISAVLLANELLPWNVPRGKVCLYHNPWAKHTYESELICLPQKIPDGDHLKSVSGESLGVIFGLPPQWPFL
jgi:hypothetical protein